MNSKPNLKRWLHSGAFLAAVFACGTASPALAQNSAQGLAEGTYSSWNISPFFGTQWFQFAQGKTIRPLTFDPGITFGVRVSEDLSRYFGLEEGAAMGFNRANFKPYGLPLGNVATLSSQNYQLSTLGVLNFRPRDKNVRPFIVL